MRGCGHALALAIGLLLVSNAAAGDDLNPYGPPTPADPPLPLGSAGEPAESAEAASPTAPERYPPARDPTGAPLPTSKKRPLPDYGVAEEPTTAGTVALWGPRVLFAPLYLVSEFAVRRPLGAFANYAEQHYWPQRFLDITSFGTYGTEHQIQVLPTVDFEWGVRLNAGLALTWDNALAHGNQIRARATVGGPDWLEIRAGDRVALDSRSSLTLAGSLGRRADLRFYGLGPSSTPDGAYFLVTQTDVGLTYQRRPWRSSMIESAVGFRSALFSSAVSNPSVDSAIASGVFAGPPPGFEGYAITYQRLAAALDTRRLRHEEHADLADDFVAPPGTGVRLEVHGEHDVELSGLQNARTPIREWLRYGGGIGLYADLTGQQRTIGLSVSTELADPTRRSEIPFTELTSLGGLEPMRAFQYYRLIDRSYVAAKASYRWPVWSGLDGAIDAAVGNVFGEHYDGFEARLLRGSFSMGVETIRWRDLAFQVLFGVGTRTIDDGFGLDGVRFVVGTSREF